MSSFVRSILLFMLVSVPFPVAAKHWEGLPNASLATESARATSRRLPQDEWRGDFGPTRFARAAFADYDFEYYLPRRAMRRSDGDVETYYYYDRRYHARRTGSKRASKHYRHRRTARRPAIRRAAHRHRQAMRRAIRRAERAHRRRIARRLPVRPMTKGVPSGTVLSGIASYYWQPQRVASGGWFDPNAMTAAHRSLPFGTRVRVTHMRNGRSVEVSINDRGPYVAGRIIDLSKAAAAALGMTAEGVARVAVTVLGK
jgi:rare lipoprotein A